MYLIQKSQLTKVDTLKVKLRFQVKCPKLECNICRKEFKNKNTLKNHDEKFHMTKGQLENGSSTVKCYNCNKKFMEKNLLKNHISKDHIICSDCKNVFPTITSLNIHITAVHDNLTGKHNLEREPSLKNHKMRRPAQSKVVELKQFRIKYIRTSSGPGQGCCFPQVSTLCT